MWAPKVDAAGRSLHHWSNMILVAPGDFVFSYARGAIGAVGVVQDRAVDHQKPNSFGDGWEQNGRRVNVKFSELTHPLLLGDFVDEIIPLLPEYNSPISVLKRGNQGYLFSLSATAGRLIYDRLAALNGIVVDHQIDDNVAASSSTVTEQDALIKARVAV
jgi:putative restriction endonuclease